jgi:BASS family bile acid:Na+ symporter
MLHNTNHRITLPTWILILIAILISLIYPKFGLTFKDYIIPLMMGLMFFSFLNINFQLLSNNLHHIKKPSFVLITVHFLSPVLLLLLKPYVIPEIFLGLIIVSASAAGISVVFLSSLFKGNPTTALLITFTSHVLAPILIPIIIFTFTRQVVEINYIAISMTIIKLIILPLLFAMFIHHFKFSKKISPHATKISSFILFFVIIGIISPVQNFLVENIYLTLTLFTIVIGLTTINFLVGYSLGKTKEEKITYGICANYKNYALASIIALSNFDPIVAIPAAVYALVNNLFLIPLQLFFLDRKK